MGSHGETQWQRHLKNSHVPVVNGEAWFCGDVEAICGNVTLPLNASIIPQYTCFSKCISQNVSPQRINNSPIHVGSLHGAYRNAARVAKCHGNREYISE